MLAKEMYKDCWRARSAALLAIGRTLWRYVPEEEDGSRRRKGLGVPLQRGKTPPPNKPPTDAQETPRRGIEVGGEYEPASDEAMEE